MWSYHSFFILLALPGQPRQRMNLASPFSYRFRRRPAIILPALKVDPRSRPGARTHPRPCAHTRVIAQPHLSGQHHAIFQHHAAGKAGLARNYAVTPDLTIVSDHDQVIELAALADHRVAQGTAIDGGGGADFDIVL